MQENRKYMKNETAGFNEDSTYEDERPSVLMFEKDSKVRGNFCSTFACDKCPYNTKKRFMILRYLNQCHKENNNIKFDGKGDDENDNTHKKIFKRVKSKRKIDGDGIFNRGTVSRMYSCDNCPYLETSIEAKNTILSTAEDVGESCCVSTCAALEESQKTNYTNIVQQEQPNSQKMEADTTNDKKDSSSVDERPLGTMINKSSKDREDFCSKFACGNCSYITKKRSLLLGHLYQYHAESKGKSNGDKVNAENYDDSHNNKLGTTIETKSESKSDNNDIHDNGGTIPRIFGCENDPSLQTTVEGEYHTLPVAIDVDETFSVSTCTAQEKSEEINYTDKVQQEQRSNDNIETETVKAIKDNSSEDEKPLVTMLRKSSKDREGFCSKYACNNCSYITKKRSLLLQHLCQYHAESKGKSNGDKVNAENYDDSHNNKLGTTIEIKRESKSDNNDIHDNGGTIPRIFGCENDPSMQTTVEREHHTLPVAIDVDETFSISTCTDLNESQNTNYTNVVQQEQPNSDNIGAESVNDTKDSSSEDERPLATILKKRSKDRDDFYSEFACDVCPYITNKRTRLLRHLNQCHMENDGESNGDKVSNENNDAPDDDILTTTVKTKNKRARNIKGKKRTLPILFCDNCSYTSTKKHFLALHMRCHSNQRPYKCNICVRAYKNKTSFLKHNKKIHDSVDIHACKQCNSSFSSVLELVYHERKQHSSQEPGKCTQCDFVAAVDIELQRHMRCHIGDCSHRNLSAKCKDPAGKRLKYSCDLCPAATKSESALRSHIQRMHYPKKDLTCNVCGDTFFNRYNYWKHKFHCTKRFKCQLCSFVGKKFINLERHMTLHAEKSFKCNECKQVFKSNLKLRRHQNLYHYKTFVGKEKEYMCYICKRSFAYKACLLRHEITHKLA